MSGDLVASLNKSLDNIYIENWQDQITALKNTTEIQNADSFAIRQSANSFRDSSFIQAKSWNSRSSAALANRVQDIEKWRKMLEINLQQIENGIKLLQEEKASAENDLESFVEPLLITSECIALRNSRTKFEITEDSPDEELKIELSSLEESQKALRAQCQAAWEAINRLIDLKLTLAFEIEDKLEIEEVNSAQVNLKPKICDKIDPTRINKKSSSYQKWIEKSKTLIQKAEHYLADAYSVREMLFITKEKAKTSLKAQQDKTSYILRKRFFETEKAQKNMEWQIFTVNQEIRKSEEDMKTLERAIKYNDEYLNIAELRFDNLSHQANIDPYEDEVHQTVFEELYNLRNIKQNLNDEIQNINSNISALKKHLNTLEINLKNLGNSLMLDKRCLDLRIEKKEKSNDSENNSEKYLQVTSDNDVNS